MIDSPTLLLDRNRVRNGVRVTTLTPYSDPTTLYPSSHWQR